MPKPTIANVFPGATVTSTTVTIPLAALATLTPSATVSADEFMAGISATAKNYYTEVRSNGDNTAVPPTTGDLDVSLIVEIGRATIVTVFDDQNNRVEFEEQEMIYRFRKLRASADFDADDYK
jgi:hypothetical protein